MSWIDSMRGVAIVDVAHQLGLTVDEKRRWISPCPACGRERRNASTPGERRGAIGLRSDVSWHCFTSSCELGGDAIDLVAASIGHARFKDLSPHRKEDVRTWCENFIGDVTPKRRASRPPPPIERVEKPYPPLAEVLELLRKCIPTAEDKQVDAYLRSRGVDAIDVDDRRLAFALPEGVSLPSWACFGAHRWTEIGNRLLVPLVDCKGEIRSVVARRVVDGESPKTLPPKGFGKSGLVWACPFMRTVLRDGMPEWWTSDAPPLRIFIVEGDSDFLTAATGAAQGLRWSDADEFAPGVLGITSGAWTAEIAARIPDGAELIVATDDDDAGWKYLEVIERSVSARIAAGTLRVSRWDSGSEAL